MSCTPLSIISQINVGGTEDFNDIILPRYDSEPNRPMYLEEIYAKYHPSVLREKVRP
jgi:hypothetical protein